MQPTNKSTIPPADRAKLFGIAVMLTTIVAIIVLAIDMQIKRDLLKIAEKAQLDLLYLKERASNAKNNGRVWEGHDLRDSFNGSVRGSNVDNAPTTLEDQAVGGESVSTTRKRRANQGRTDAQSEGNDPTIPSTDK